MPRFAQSTQSSVKRLSPLAWQRSAYYDGMVQRPPRLVAGDRVRVVAPAGPFARDRFDAGIGWLRERYDVVVGEEVYDVHRYFAGRVDRRQAGLLAALEDREARAIFCARGGYGAAHLLPQLDLGRHSPQVLVGFSDITALHLAWQAAGRISIHGPVVTQLGEIADAQRAQLVALLEDPHPPPTLAGTTTISGGSATGLLLGGNLAVLTSLVGTPYLPTFDGAVLLLEDVGERPYRLDRMWTQLRFAGVLEGVAGIALGHFTRCDEPGTDAGEVLAELAASLGVPCAAGFPIGHDAPNVPVPLGVSVTLDADAAQMSFRSAAVV